MHKWWPLLPPTPLLSVSVSRQVRRLAGVAPSTVTLQYTLCALGRVNFKQNQWLARLLFHSFPAFFLFYMKLNFFNHPKCWDKSAVSFKQLMIVKITVCSSSIPLGTPNATLNVINIICKWSFWLLVSIWGNLVTQPVCTNELSDESYPSCWEGHWKSRPPFPCFSLHDNMWWKGKELWLTLVWSHLSLN